MSTLIEKFLKDGCKMSAFFTAEDLRCDRCAETKKVFTVQVEGDGIEPTMAVHICKDCFDEMDQFDIEEKKTSDTEEAKERIKKRHLSPSVDHVPDDLDTPNKYGRFLLSNLMVSEDFLNGQGKKLFPKLIQVIRHDLNQRVKSGCYPPFTIRIQQICTDKMNWWLSENECFKDQMEQTIKKEFECDDDVINVEVKFTGYPRTYERESSDYRMTLNVIQKKK